MTRWLYAVALVGPVELVDPVGAGRAVVVPATVMMSADTSVTTPAFSATTTSPESTAARYSMPVPTSGASARTSGTA
jgi:hypothetical protein